MNNIELKTAIRTKYAWPGGYPLFGICCDGGALCIDCMKLEYKQIAYARRNNLRDGWRVDAVEINWEDDCLYCEHCSNLIESAYGENIK